jgi:hypothetical protein
VFGRWIADEPLRWNAGRLRGRTPLAHTSYWRIPGSTDSAASQHLATLQAALDLDRRKDLEALVESIPPEAWLEAGR